MPDLHRMYAVYIVASIQRALYTGVTRDVYVRTGQHRQAGDWRSFTARYRCNRLVYFEYFRDIRHAISREKQIKRYRRSKKIALIEKMNPEWADLTTEPSKARFWPEW